MTCKECPLRERCYERRGICLDCLRYMERIERTRKQIAKLNNENQAPPSVRTVSADKGDIQEACGRGYVEALAGGRDSVRLQPETSADPKTEAETESISEAAEVERNGKEGSPQKAEVLDGRQGAGSDRDV